MKNKIRLSIIVLCIGCIQHSFAGDSPKNSIMMFATFLKDTIDLPILTLGQNKEAELSSRRTTSIIYSCVLPGSGQTMLGSTYKGVGFTLLAFGSALTAGISHNNFIARNERLDALEFLYTNATTWENADLIYSSMRGAHSQLQQDKNRRDLFLIITAVVWVSNIIDIMYFTEDQGQSLFSTTAPQQPMKLGISDSPHKPLLSLSLPLQ